MNRYAVSDLHGQLDLYNQIKEYVNEDDIIYMLGDAGDRGPEPWLTLKTCLDDPQITYIMGNHDLMLLQAIRKEGYDSLDLLYSNGGYGTYKGWQSESKEDQQKYLQKLLYLPVEVCLNTFSGIQIVSLSHAGYTPGREEADDVEDFVWDRNHIYHKKVECTSKLIIHGHTPIPYLIKNLEYAGICYNVSRGYCVYASGTKIDIDRGAHYTGETVLLNIDTLEAVTFKVREDENEEDSEIF